MRVRALVAAASVTLSFPSSPGHDARRSPAAPLVELDPAGARRDVASTLAHPLGVDAVELDPAGARRDVAGEGAPLDEAPRAGGAGAPSATAPPPAPDHLAVLVNVHTGERVLLTESEPSPEAFSALVEDRASGERVPMAPRLLELLRELAASRDHPRIELVSGFRSPKRNESLRKKEHKVASHSEHSLGHALDFRVEGLTPKELRREIERLGWRGGLGQYDKPTDRFVHADIGRNRRWRDP